MFFLFIFNAFENACGNAADYAKAGADFLVTSWPYFGRPHDVKMRMSASPDTQP